MQRTNQAWLDELQGRLGNERLEAAHQELGRYLYSVAYQQLLSRQMNTPLLNSFDAYEIAQLASDFVQQTLEKLVRNHFALLDTYEERGSFTGWVATIILNEVRQELRRPSWQKSFSFDPYAEGSRDGSGGGDVEQRGSAAVHTAFVASASAGPEATVLRAMTGDAVSHHLQECVRTLKEMRRTVFWEVECEGRAVQEVARAYGITPNAASLHLFRARYALRQCLEKKGITAEVLELFAQ